MDIELFYEEMGSGEPLILLHGNGEDHTIFNKIADYFSGKYRVISIDTRGHGESPMGEEPFSLYQFAEDLNDFMDEHNIEKANILGFSDGGNIALIFASEYPEGNQAHSKRSEHQALRNKTAGSSGDAFPLYALFRCGCILRQIRA